MDRGLVWIASKNQLTAAIVGYEHSSMRSREQQLLFVAAKGVYPRCAFDLHDYLKFTLGLRIISEELEVEATFLVLAW